MPTLLLHGLADDRCIAGGDAPTALAATSPRGYAACPAGRRRSLSPEGSPGSASLGSRLLCPSTGEQGVVVEPMEVPWCIQCLVDVRDRAAALLPDQRRSGCRVSASRWYVHGEAAELGLRERKSVRNTQAGLRGGSGRGLGSINLRNWRSRTAQSAHAAVSGSIVCLQHSDDSLVADASWCGRFV